VTAGAAGVVRACAAAILLAGCASSSRVVAPEPDAPVVPAPEPVVVTPAAPDSSAPPPAADPAVAVGLDDARKAELAAQARKDIAAAERAIGALAPAPAGSTRAEKLRTAQSLLAAARDAVAADPEAAATLARKARVLAEELSSS